MLTLVLALIGQDASPALLRFQTRVAGESSSSSADLTGPTTPWTLVASSWINSFSSSVPPAIRARGKLILPSTTPVAWQQAFFSCGSSTGGVSRVMTFSTVATTVAGTEIFGYTGVAPSNRDEPGAIAPWNETYYDGDTCTARPTDLSPNSLTEQHYFCNRVGNRFIIRVDPADGLDVHCAANYVVTPSDANDNGLWGRVWVRDSTLIPTQAELDDLVTATPRTALVSNSDLLARDFGLGDGSLTFRELQQRIAALTQEVHELRANVTALQAAGPAAAPPPPVACTNPYCRCGPLMHASTRTDVTGWTICYVTGSDPAPVRHVPASELLPAIPRFANAAYGVWHFASMSDPSGIAAADLLSGPCRPLSKPVEGASMRPAWYNIPYDEGYTIPSSSWSGTSHIMVVCVRDDSV